MKRTLMTILVAALPLGPAVLAADVKVESDSEKTLYALGLMLSQRVTSFRLTEAELEIVKAGLTDGALGRPKKVEQEAWSGKVGELAKARAALAAEENKKAGAAFLEKAIAEDKTITRAASGLAVKTLSEGTGANPAATDKVKVHYRGTLIDGTEFDSSYKRNAPATFGLNQVIACWTEGVQKIKVGGKARLYCPSDIAYGDQGRPSIPPGATLLFEIELLSIEK